MAKEKKRVIKKPNEFEDTTDPRLKKRIGIFWYYQNINGQRIRRSLKTNNFTLAKKLADEINQLALTGENLNKEKTFFENAWEDFLQDKALGRKTIKARDSTLQDYIRYGNRYFKPFFEGKKVDRIKESDFDEYIIFVRKLSGKPDIKIFNHWKYLTSFLSWALKKGLIKKKLYLQNPDITPEEGVGKNYTDDELKAFRDNSEGEFKLYIYMAQFMGMRSGEITQLMKNRVDLNRQLIALRKQDTKTNQARKVPIHPEVLPLLKAQIESTKSPAVFPNRIDVDRPMHKHGFKHLWEALKKKLKIQGRFHDLRHSYATRIFSQSNINPIIICQALGMSLDVARKVYIHFDETHLKDLASGFKL